jgi:hypothetical protein
MGSTHILTYGRFILRVKQRLNDLEQKRHLKKKFNLTLYNIMIYITLIERKQNGELM